MFFSKQKKIKIDLKKNLLQNPKILEVNLIKDEVRIGFDWNKNISVLLLVLFIAGILIGEIYYGLDWWEKQESLRSQSLATDVAKVNSEINQIKTGSDAALVFKDKSNELGRLLNEHIYWSNFFSWLEKKTLSSVTYSDFSGDAKGVYTLNAKASNYAEVSWQVKAFLDDKMTKGVDVLNVSLASVKEKEKIVGKGVSFSLNLEVNPEIFKK